MKTVKNIKTKWTGNGRAGTTTTFSCPYCKYKFNSFRTAFNWDTTISMCESCQKEFIVINTHSDTRKTPLENETV